MSNPTFKALNVWTDYTPTTKGINIWLGSNSNVGINLKGINLQSFEPTTKTIFYSSTAFKSTSTIKG